MKWIKTLWCFMRGHYWIQLYCPERDMLREFCPRCKEDRSL